jgi:cation-transporting ATPase 13A1
VNNPDFETKIENSMKGVLAAEGGAGHKKSRASNSKDRMARAAAELNAQFEDHSVIKLGDASIASPFTSRRTSIDSVLSVIRQGRATLVTTIQIFKILALNCLISAYFMSTLYLRGLKQGDTQMTVSGLASALLFFFLSQSKPLQRIHPSKPQTSVFQKSVFVSVGGQFVVHLLCLVGTLRLCESYLNSEDPSLAVDGKFQPNIINTAMYLLSVTMLVNNFVVNYCGHPFVQSIRDNAMLWRSIIGLYAGIIIVVGGQVEPLNDALQLTPFPGADFQTMLLMILLFNFGASYSIELACRKYL